MANIIKLWTLLPFLLCVTGDSEDADINFHSHLSLEFSNFEDWAINRTGNPTFSLNMPISRHIVSNYTSYSYNRVDLRVTYSGMTIEGALRDIYEIHLVPDTKDNQFYVEWSTMVKLKGRYDIHGIFQDYFVERRGDFETDSYIFPDRHVKYTVNNEGNMEKGKVYGSCEVEPTGYTKFEDLYDDRPLGKRLSVFLSYEMASGIDFQIPSLEGLTDEFIEEFIFKKYSYEEITSPLVTLSVGNPSL